MASNDRAFLPAYQSGGSITAGAASSNRVVDSTGRRQSVRVTNTGTDLVFVRCGGSTVVATANDLPVRGGTDLVISKAPEDTHFAVIAPSGAPVVYSISGMGL